jgi:hypothetical protein
VQFRCEFSDFLLSVRYIHYNREISTFDFVVVCMRASSNTQRDYFHWVNRTEGTVINTSCREEMIFWEQEDCCVFIGSDQLSACSGIHYQFPIADVPSRWPALSLFWKTGGDTIKEKIFSVRNETRYIFGFCHSLRYKTLRRCVLPAFKQFFLWLTSTASRLKRKTKLVGKTWGIFSCTIKPY